MKFTKVNKNTIRCQMSREEMSERGIEINDIMEDRGKAEAFLRDILTEAKNSLHFDLKGEALNVQMSVMKNGTVTIQISDDKNARIRQLLQELQQRIMEGNAASPDDVIDVPPDSRVPGVVSPVVDLSQYKPDEEVKLHLWIEVGDMDEAVALSKNIVKSCVPMRASLYHYGDLYIFEANVDEKRADIAQTVFVISEFSDNVYSDDGVIMEAKEHGKCLIRDTAFETLASM
jgi:negative regulator of genetic competence, sporulation and motility